MKIWEIEEGREFREITSKRITTRYKFEKGSLYVNYGDWWENVTTDFNTIWDRIYEYLPEKKYYLKLKSEMNYGGNDDFLNCVCEHGDIFLDDSDDGVKFKTKFTEKEIRELIPPLWLTVCEPIEVENEI